MAPSIAVAEDPVFAANNPSGRRGKQSLFRCLSVPATKSVYNSNSTRSPLIRRAAGSVGHNVEGTTSSSKLTKTKGTFPVRNSPLFISASTRSSTCHLVPRLVAPRPCNVVAVRRTASRLCRRRHRESFELLQQLQLRLNDEDEDACGCRDNVFGSQLLLRNERNRQRGIRFKFNGRSRSLQRGTVPSINDTGSLQLVAFRKVKPRSHSVEDTSPSRSESSSELEEILANRTNSRLVLGVSDDPFEIATDPDGHSRGIGDVEEGTTLKDSIGTPSELSTEATCKAFVGNKKNRRQWLDGDSQFRRGTVELRSSSRSRVVLGEQQHLLLQEIEDELRARRKAVRGDKHDLSFDELIVTVDGRPITLVGKQYRNKDKRKSSAQEIEIEVFTFETMERQESFKKQVKDTQEWFRSGGSVLDEDASPWSSSGQLGKFFEEASAKCSESGTEEFADFLQRNRESFNRFLETRCSSSKRLVDRDSGVFTEQEIQQHGSMSSSTGGCSSTTSFQATSKSTSATVHSKSKDSIGCTSSGGSNTAKSTLSVSPASSAPSPTTVGPSSSSSASQRQLHIVKSSSQDNHSHNVHKMSTVHRTESQIRTSGTHPEFKTIIELNGDNNVPPDALRHPDNVGLGLTASSEPQLRAAILKRPLSEFPRFPPLPSEGSKLPGCQRMSTGFEANMSSSYHFSSTSRSRFQYCGETNTFKFSTEHVSSSFSEQGYESVSESEDEESVDVDDEGDDESHRRDLDVMANVSVTNDGSGSMSKCNLIGVQGSLSTSETSDSLRAIDSNSIETTGIGSSQLSNSGSTTNNANVTSRSESCVTLNALEHQQKTQNALREIAYELLTTERTYVAILTLLDQVFHFRVDQENRATPMFSQEVITQMFSNLKSLYKLHNDFVLPKLEERLQNWELRQGIGDLMRELAPFLKMYTEYVKNYDTAMHLIATWYQKQPRFAAIMDYVHSLPECGKLQVSHHMLTPVQRIPRYELLLKEYLKKLPEDSPDRDNTQKALELVSTAAQHANEAMKKIHKFKKLLEIQDLVGGVMDLVSPSRELLKEGRVTKISARSGDTQERHLFVFNDLVLLCSQRLISQRVGAGPPLRVRARLDMDGLIVEEGDNLETPNTFYIRNTGRSIELCTTNSGEKLEWMQVLAKAVHDLAQKKSSLKVHRDNSPNGNGLSLQEGDLSQQQLSNDQCDSMKSPMASLDLGRSAPRLVRSDQVSHCMNCATPFSTFGRWKHHCHACGIVACRKCLSQKMRLAYDASRLLRVCDRCHQLLVQSAGVDQQDVQSASNDTDENSDQCNIRSLPESPILPHADKAVMCGPLRLRTNGRSTWSKRWFALQPDFVLYSYKNQEDKLPLTSTPVPGFLVSLLEKGDAVDPKTPHAFKLFHVKKTYYFQAADSDEQRKWTSALDQASRAEDLV
ncbi:FYVE, RhoGEF and PH domain-containing protein 5-like isoform X2 [Varroa jacobsoni]|nr:FYVE, RhoGEF and PH domain-containing protein 5-like isoform X2 [Varroa jacobsoni]XP_022703504.1 FYVE, RhoGEF and PH domain-containing protein 5-like isoform X2 [Varroa jacobsoni]XP_022703505.1 FYVE, RhoGEF and PH domain-containing protein 5-like isoform X2 [Varroa jacobsoni]XP_022703506.1 FYVE, RhoGEF and PH domain-containing protein 5-like isoform X2 [Varroa jacobsoni]